MTRWLVTGAAGFIGAHVCARLVRDGDTVLGLDNCNDYYDPALKRARLRWLEQPGFQFRHGDITDRTRLAAAFDEAGPVNVVHLAAQAGVRYSMQEPLAYVAANATGFANVLEECRLRSVSHLVYASSSSVYGATSRMPFSVHDPADHPVSVYAATKRAGEILAHGYSHVYGLATTGLRFFTVYGPWGRPDMAYYRFTEALLEGRPLTVFGDGSALRDFTYIDDVVEGVVRVARMPPAGSPEWRPDTADPATSPAPWRLLNIGHGEQASISELIATLERYVGRRAERLVQPAVTGDVPATHADTSDLAALTGFVPQVRLADGLQRFVDWYLEYRR